MNIGWLFLKQPVFAWRQLQAVLRTIHREKVLNPEEFLAKLSARLHSNPRLYRLAARILVPSVDASPETKTGVSFANRARSAFETGELAWAIELAAAGDTETTQLLNEYRNLNWEFDQDFPKSQELSKVSNVLCLFTNSLPHTSSGYSLRSHATMQAMRSAGLKVSAVTRLDYPAEVGRLAKSRIETVDGIKYYRLVSKTNRASASERIDDSVEQIIKIAKNVGAEAILTTTPFRNALVASRAAEKLGIPWLYEVRGEPEKTWLASKPSTVEHIARNSSFFKRSQTQETAAARSAAQVIALSQISKETFCARGVDGHSIEVVPNGVNDSVFAQRSDRAELRREFDLPVDAVLVGAVTSIVGYEGLENLIEALADLDERFHVVLVGSGSAEVELKELVEQRGFGERVTFAGRQSSETIWKWYDVLDCFVVPRKDTPVCRTVTPIKTVIAQARGIPIVASDLPALREVTGGLEIYVEPENPALLAAAIRQAIGRKNPESAKWANERAWSKLGERYRKILHGIAE